jgi:hypothetical protein
LPWQGCQPNLEEIRTTSQLTTTTTTTTTKAIANDKLKDIYLKYLKTLNLEKSPSEKISPIIIPSQVVSRENNTTDENSFDLNYIGPQNGDNHGKRGKKNFSLLFQEGLHSSMENDSQDTEEIQERYAYIIVPVKVSNSIKLQNKNSNLKLPYKQSKYPIASKDKQKNYQGKRSRIFF